MPRKPKTYAAAIQAAAAPGAQKPAAEDVAPFNARIPSALLWDLRELQTRLGRERGARVKLEDLAAEALRDLLKKYKGK